MKEELDTFWEVIVKVAELPKKPLTEFVPWIHMLPFEAFKYIDPDLLIEKVTFRRNKYGKHSQKIESFSKEKE